MRWAYSGVRTAANTGGHGPQNQSRLTLLGIVLALLLSSPVLAQPYVDTDANAASGCDTHADTDPNTYSDGGYHADTWGDAFRRALFNPDANGYGRRTSRNADPDGLPAGGHPVRLDVQLQSARLDVPDLRDHDLHQHGPDDHREAETVK